MKLFYYMIFFIIVSLLNDVRATREIFEVDSFQKLSIDGRQVDLDEIHSNLKKFEEHATKENNNNSTTNNVAVGAITVFYGEKKDEFSNSKIGGVRTFYLEDTSETLKRNLLFFESTPGETTRYIEWGSSGLGFVDGHSMLVGQPPNIKSLCFKEMQEFFSKIHPDDFDDLEIEPLIKMQKIFAEVLKSVKKFKSAKDELGEMLSPIVKLGENCSSLFSESAALSDSQNDILLDYSSFDDEDLFDGEDLTKAKDYIYEKNAFSIIKNIKEGLYSIEEDDISSNIEEFEGFMKDVNKKINLIYRTCWHSEQRLFHFLFPSGNEYEYEDGYESDSNSSVSEDGMHNPSLGTRFDWDSLASLGGDFEPKLIFLHVHSHLNFCDMCLYTLYEFVPRLMSEKNISENFLIGITGSYREEYSEVKLERKIGKVPWLEVKNFSTFLEKFKEHSSDENSLPSIYLQKMS